jgi:hypothetical protein
MFRPRLNLIEPPWYVTRMPGGVGGVAPRGVPLSRSTSVIGGPNCQSIDIAWHSSRGLGGGVGACASHQATSRSGSSRRAGSRRASASASATPRSAAGRVLSGGSSQPRRPVTGLTVSGGGQDCRLVRYLSATAAISAARSVPLMQSRAFTKSAPLELM